MSKTKTNKIKKYVKVSKEPVIKSRNFPKVYEVEDFGFILRTFRNKEKGNSYLCFEISGSDIWSKEVSETESVLASFNSLIQTIFIAGFDAHILVSNTFSELNTVLHNSRKITQKNINLNNPKFAYAAYKVTKEIKSIQQTDEDLKLMSQFAADKKVYYLMVGIGDLTEKKSIEQEYSKLREVIGDYENSTASEIKTLGKLPELNFDSKLKTPYKTFKDLEKKAFENPEQLNDLEKVFLDGCLSSYSKLDRVVGTMLTGYSIRSNALVEIIERASGLEMKLNVSVSDFNPSNEVSHVDKILKDYRKTKLLKKETLTDLEKEELEDIINPPRYERILNTKKLISIYRITVKVKEFSRVIFASWMAELSEIHSQYSHAINIKMSGFLVSDPTFIKKIEFLIDEAFRESQKLERMGKLSEAEDKNTLANQWYSIVTGGDIGKMDIINSTVSISFNYFTREALEKHQDQLYNFLNDASIPNTDENIPTVNFSKVRHLSDLMGGIRKNPLLNKIRENKWNQIKAFENNGLPYLIETKKGNIPTKTFVEESIYVPETTFALAYPFLSGSFIQPTGLPIGTIRGTNEPIIIDPTRKQKGAHNSNVVIFGMSGSGKSTLAKKLSKIITLLNAQVIIFDIENENSLLVNNLSGEIITLGKEIEGGFYNTINPLQTMVAKTEMVLKNVGIKWLKLLDYEFFRNPEYLIRKLRSKKLATEKEIRRLRNIHKVFKDRKLFFMDFLKIILYEHQNYRNVATYRKVIDTAISYIFSYEIIDRIEYKKKYKVEKLFQGKISDIEKLIREEDYHFPHSISGLQTERKKPKSAPKFPNNTQKELKDTCDFLSYPADYEAWNQPTTITMTNNLTNLALKGVFGGSITEAEQNAWMFLLLAFIDDHVNSKSNRLSDEKKALMKTQEYKEKRAKEEGRYLKKLGDVSEEKRALELNRFKNESDYNECKPVNVIVDEAHMMIDEKNPVALKYFSQFTKRIRKRNGFITFITQNVADFVPEGNAEIKKYSTTIVNNTQYFFVFNMKKNDLDAFVKLFENGRLSEQEINSIAQAQPGEGLFIYGREKLMIKVNIEHDYNVIGVSLRKRGGSQVISAKNVEELGDYNELSNDIKKAHEHGDVDLTIDDID